MSAIRGKYIDGQIILNTTPDWPNGTELVVDSAAHVDKLGLSEDEWDESPEGIAAWLAWYDSLEPFLTPEDEAAWKKAREEQKAWELAHWDEHSRKLEKLFE